MGDTSIESFFSPSSTHFANCDSNTSLSDGLVVKINLNWNEVSGTFPPLVTSTEKQPMPILWRGHNEQSMLAKRPHDVAPTHARWPTNTTTTPLCQRWNYSKLLTNRREQANTTTRQPANLTCIGQSQQTHVFGRIRQLIGVLAALPLQQAHALFGARQRHRRLTLVQRTLGQRHQLRGVALLFRLLGQRCGVERGRCIGRRRCGCGGGGGCAGCGGGLERGGVGGGKHGLQRFGGERVENAGRSDRRVGTRTCQQVEPENRCQTHERVTRW